ncbi:MAG: tetratricopeptide repeat protein [Lentisphaerae bacterium]|nr:tetratricopeptide repeat protein [Lentisphaerota bacterium]
MKIALAAGLLTWICFSWGALAQENAAPGSQVLPGSGNSGDDAATFAGRTDSSKRYMRLGELALENDDANSAAEFFAQALSELKDLPQQGICMDFLHESLLEANRFGEADLLAAKLKELPEFPDRNALLTLMNGRRMFFSGQFKEAVRILGELTGQLVPERRIGCQALELQGRAMNLLGDFSGAQKCFADLAAVAGKNIIWQLKAWEGMIFNALDAGNLEQVGKLWSRMQQAVPDDQRRDFSSHWQKISWLIKCYEGKFDAVEPELRKVVKSVRPPDALLARIALAGADSRLSQKRFAEAAELNDLALKFADSSLRMEVLRSKIQTGISGGALKQALQDLEQYLAKFPAAADRFYFMMLQGNLNYRLKNTREAIECYLQVKNSAEASWPQKIESALELGKIYQKEGEPQKALEMFEYAVKSETAPEKKLHLMHIFGEYLYLLGRYSDAAGWFEQAAAAPGEAGERSQLFLAQTLYQLKSYGKAAAAVQKVLSSRQAEIKRKAQYLNALLTEKLSEPDDAVKAFADFAASYPKAVEAPEALFQAAVLALESTRYEAWKLFLQFADRYPGESAANALYRAHGELLKLNKADAAASVLDRLIKDHSQSKYTVGAQFRQLDQLKAADKTAEALQLLDNIDKNYSGKYPELKPQILYDRALLFQQQQQWQQMFAPLEELTGKYADSVIAPQAFFLLGDLRSQDGKLEEALNAFKQARERSSGEFFAWCCSGRSADTAYALYSRTRQEKYLLMALNEYKSLLNIAQLPMELRLQSLCKLGRCMEDAADEAGALRCYRELLYQAWMEKRSGHLHYEQWSSRALNSALTILLKALRENPAPDQAEVFLQEAERLLKLAGELELPGEDSEKLLQQLRNYRMEERK